MCQPDPWVLGGTSVRVRVWALWMGWGLCGQAVVRIEGYVGVGDCLNEVCGRADCEDEDRRAVRMGIRKNGGLRGGVMWMEDVWTGSCEDRVL